MSFFRPNLSRPSDDEDAHAYAVVTPPASEPLTLPDVKTHLRLIGDDEDAYLLDLIAAARARLEMLTRRALVTQTLRLTLDDFPLRSRVIELRRPPVQSVTSVQYTDGTGATQTLASNLYDVDVTSEPARVVLRAGTTWPTTYDGPGAVRLTFVAGWEVAAVPAAARHALRLLVSHWYAQREPVVTGTIVTPVPDAVDALAAQLKWGM